MDHSFSNELVKETSPYLLQHAHNPVQWHAWSEETLAMAKATGKPILVSIGYAACHWCHVMERESFEDKAVADYMNEHFTNIKVDREERPDVDHIYMEAVQAIAGNGGWPLNVFLTPDARPFYGGTYFPPQKAFNRPSWKEVLENISEAWQSRRHEMEAQADNLLDHIRNSSRFITDLVKPGDGLEKTIFTREQCHTMATNLLKNADMVHGGFGQAPKFPQTFVIGYLLFYGRQFNHAPSLKQALFSLEQLVNGGIYDQLAGGMARYSTDAYWLAPHFEKMLYDNALLVSVLADAFQVTKSVFYEQAISDTLGFLVREMKHEEGGFYAALDADSEGEEGKYYVWDKQEIDSLLGEQAKIFCDWYNVTEKGNWEGKNILHVNKTVASFARENGMEQLAFEKLLSDGRQKLLATRKTRIPPGTDDKIILGWNALLLTAFCKAYAATGTESYKAEAVELYNFINEKFSKDGLPLWHTYKNGQARHPAYLDDLACLVQAGIYLQEITGDAKYLIKAKDLAGHTISHFLDEEGGFFYYTRVDQNDVIARKPEFYDGAVPSGNSIMAENLLYLSAIFENAQWLAIGNRLVEAILPVAIKYPSSFGIWAGLVLKQTLGTHEVILTGSGNQALLKEVLGIYLPNKVLQTAETELPLPLLKNKFYGEKPVLYLCREYRCSPPVTEISAFLDLLNGGEVGGPIHNK